MKAGKNMAAFDAQLLLPLMLLLLPHERGNGHDSVKWMVMPEVA